MSSIPALLRLARPHQWSKNLLVFLPLLAGHRLDDAPAWMATAGFFVALSLAASAVYVVNDWIDREHDREDVVRRARPLASGAVTPVAAFAMAGALLLAALGLAWRSGPVALSSVVAYLALALAYCLAFRRVPWVDILALAGLFVLRVLGGAAVSDVVPSAWLIAFTGFLFFSLAVLKRYAELAHREVERLGGRGYAAEDAPVLLAVGVGTAIASVVVLALYVEGHAGGQLYSRPAWLWPACPLLLTWHARLWTLAHRGAVRLDPLGFALVDPPSWLVLAGIVTFAWLAK